MQVQNGTPFTHGMEIEQFPNALPSRVRSYTMNNEEGTLDGWHRDASGPRETSVGPYKNVKSILDRFYTDTRDAGITWNWHASHNSSGAGSHVHLCLSDDAFEDRVSAWTIAYNTVVEMFPFYAPFFCHNWEDGFRDGTTYGASQLNVDRWAEAQLTRYSTETVRDRVENPRAYRREYSAVTFNPAQQSGKPLTIELRANDAHPAMALPGLLQLRRVVGQAVKHDWSPKLENHRATLRRCYHQIYERATEVGLITAMQEPIEGGITFEEGRGIPGVDTREFDTMYEVLKATQRNPYSVSSKNYRYRAQRLVLGGRDDYSPHNNATALWHTDTDGFEWENGPTMTTQSASEGDAARNDAAVNNAVATDGGEN